MNEYSFSDEVIAQIAKLVQLAILTGTDVVDNLRTLRVTPSDGGDDSLCLSQEYKKIGESHVQQLLSQLEEIRDSNGEIVN